jgi:prepilin-type N-terminal cleavage/methylation domain-containing protein
MKKSKGFTLIELMVVIVILGILAAVIAPRIPQFVNKAKEGRTKGNMATLRSTMNIYYSDNDGFYVRGDPTLSLVPKYLKDIPTCETLQHGKNGGFDTTNAIGATDAGSWGYVSDQTQNSWGDIWIQCSHTDLSGNRWTSY